MLTVIIKDDGEANVIKLTYENLYRELKDIPDAQLLVAKNWFDEIDNVKTNYVCLVEADCLVNSGFFASQLGLFKKNAHFRKLAMLATATGVNNWANRVYGYNLGHEYSDGIVPNLGKKSDSIYPIQIGFVPGATIRLKMLKKALETTGIQKPGADLVAMSADLSLAFWRQGDGNRVHINPNTTYVTTEDYVNDIDKYKPRVGTLATKFERESI